MTHIRRGKFGLNVDFSIETEHFCFRRTLSVQARGDSEA